MAALDEMLNADHRWKDEGDGTCIKQPCAFFLSRLMDESLLVLVDTKSDNAKRILADLAKAREQAAAQDVYLARCRAWSQSRIAFVHNSTNPTTRANVEAWLTANPNPDGSDLEWNAADMWRQLEVYQANNEKYGKGELISVEGPQF